MTPYKIGTLASRKIKLEIHLLEKAHLQLSNVKIEIQIRIECILWA